MYFEIFIIGFCIYVIISIKLLKLKQMHVMTKLSELNTILTSVNTVLEKVAAEVQKLKDSLGDAEIPAEAQASLDKLTTLAKSIDDINPDTV